MSSRHPYDRQARSYDETRAASPSVLRPLLEALAGAPGPELLDVGGGTGNYALALRDHGFRPRVLDLDTGMLSRAATKGLATARADATALPCEDASADAVTLVSMLHHVPEWPRALAEAQRVLRPDGRLAVMLWAREHIEQVAWLVEFFPSSRGWMLAQHPALDELLGQLPGGRAIPLFFTDVEDGSIGALQRRPELLLDPQVRRQTSFFERVGDTAPEELATGLARLEVDLAAGRQPDQERDPARARIGDATVLTWAKPGREPVSAAGPTRWPAPDPSSP